MIDKEPAAEPVVGDDGTATGGFAKAAEHLNALYPNRQRPISRQLVHKWWIYRHYNGFPESTGTTGSGRGRPIFNLADVTGWYAKYTATRGGVIPQQPEVKQYTVVTTLISDEDTLAA